jgi:hypothetical protein
MLTFPFQTSNMQRIGPWSNHERIGKPKTAVLGRAGMVKRVSAEIFRTEQSVHNHALPTSGFSVD